MADVPAAIAVLDTNVCLDLFVFDDPRAAPLRHALQHRTLQAITDADCRDEWRRVLAYPQWMLPAAAQAAHLARFDAMVTITAATPGDPMPSVAVPRCRDGDDQKFLDLAARIGARWLLTRDSELLRLSRRTQRDFGCVVLTPQAWADSMGADSMGADSMRADSMRADPAGPGSIDATGPG